MYFYPNPDNIGIYKETYNHFNAANAFRVEKELRDWLFVSGGYLYSRLNGDGSFNQVLDSISAPGMLRPGDSSQRITLSQESHTLNANIRLGPWSGLTGAAGVQGEWQRREGLSDFLTPGTTNQVPASGASNSDRSSVDETFELRYDRIPFTVLYAGTRFQQEWNPVITQLESFIHRRPVRI